MSLLDAFADLKVIASEWSRSLADNAASRQALAPLEIVVRSFGEPQERVSLSCPRSYLAEWQSNHADAISLQSIKRLCWEPNVVADPRFGDALERLDVLYPRQIQGLVHCLHQAWDQTTAISRSRKRAHDALLAYPGKHRLIKLWRDHAPCIVAYGAAAELGRRLAREQLLPDETFHQLRLDHVSPFAQAVVKEALADCRTRWAQSTEHLSYAMRHLLTWPGWNLSALKVAIGPIILDAVFKIPEWQQQLVSQLLRDARFGDPRFPANRGKWASMDPSARRQVIEWLSRVDIVFFFEHVLPDRNDPHGRKEFWLRYVSGMSQSRPLLNAEDRARLRATIEKSAIDDAAIGIIEEQTSAFILGFDNLCVVEFSRRGNACYVYRQQAFNQLLRDIYTPLPLKHLHLKVAESAEARVVHREGWQFEMANVLARFGIRPR